MRSIAWFKHLLKRRGTKFFKQMYKMWNFHRTSFDDLLDNIFSQLDNYDASFTFPTIASVTPYQPDNIKSILEEGHEIANHGFKHIKYEHLSDNLQYQEFKKSMEIFNSLNIPIHGFRAPYNNYNDRTIELVNEFGFQWDGGIGLRKEYRNGNEMFRYDFNGKESEFIVIPLHRYSDDLLIDRYNVNREEFSKIIIPLIKNASKKGGVLMFDFHPIRIGQDNYAPVLGDVVEEAHILGAWIPTVHEAVSYWDRHGSWKGDASFCLLLTGDIDNFAFFDYVRRLI